MPDTKISALAAGAALATGDLFVAVDVSDTSMAASGTDKKWTVATITADPVFLAGLEPHFPLGEVGSALVVADQTGITALTDMTGYTITFTAVAGRIYHAHYAFGATQLTSAGSQTFRINDSVAGDLGIIHSSNQIVNVTGAGSMVSGFWRLAGLTAASHTIKLRATTTAGTLTIPSASTVNGRFSIVDVGTI